MTAEVLSPRARDRLSGAAGAAALFSGAALVTHIVSRVSLRLALAVAGVIVTLSATVVWRGASSAARQHLRRRAATGAMSGLIATGMYDATKTTLSWLDPSPYNPFEAIRAFGRLLAGPGAARYTIYATGCAFHLLNGTLFGVAFAFLFGRRGTLAGVLWGLFLEIFQLMLFPGWLDIRFYREFVQISALSHVVYGAVLGALCRRVLAPAPPRAPRPPALRGTLS